MWLEVEGWSTENDNLRRDKIRRQAGDALVCFRNYSIISVARTLMALLPRPR